jgi:PKD repeat protein
MDRFIYRARWVALLAFFAVGCNGQEGELLDPALDEQVSPLSTPPPGQSSVPVHEGLSYGHLTWRPIGPRTAEFTVLSAFNRIYPGSGPDGLAVTGDLFEESDTQARLCFGYLDDDCLTPLTYEVIDYNAEEGWLLGRAVTPPGPQPLPGTGVTVMETEPNASIDTANVMNQGDDYIGNLSLLWDEDYVGFTLTEQTPISIRTVLEGLPDAWVTLLSSSGEELASNHGGGWPPGPQDIQITLEAGTYYLQLRGPEYFSGRATLELRELGNRPASPITHTYSGAGTYQASLEGCCTLSQGNWHDYTVSTQVRFDLPNSSPVSTLQPIIDAPINTPDLSFQIPATDAEGDQLTFRLASPAESGIEELPAGLAVSNSGLVSWNTTWASLDEQWSIQVVIEERRDGQLIGSSAVKFLLRIVPANHPPVCVLPPQTAYDVGLGEDLVFTIGSSDPDPETWVELNAIDLPDNAYASPYVPLWGPSGSAIDIHWTTPFIDSWVGRTFTLNFTVTDWEGLATPCSVDVHIVPPRLPEANAGPDLTVLEGASVMLDGRGSSDPAGEELSYSWQVLEPHPGATLSSPSSPTPLFTPSDDGIYTVRLGVKNSHGTWVYDTVTVTVENVAPVAVAQGAFIAPGTEFIASGSIIDPGQDQWTVTVDYGDGSGLWSVGVERHSFILAHVYADSGTYPVVISVTDDEGAVSETTVQVHVDPRYMVPMVSLSHGAFLMEGEPYSASGSFIDLDSSSWTATVDYGDGSGEQPLVLDGQSFTLSHVYADSGYYPIFVRVTDDGGATGMYLSVVLVINRAPEVIATADPILEGSTAVITGSFTDPGADTWEAWANFGEGWEPVHLNSDKSFTLTHRYPYAGTFWVDLYVLDDDGDAGYIWMPVVVNNHQPVVEISTLGTAEEGREWFGAGSFTTGPERGYFYSHATVDYGDGSEVEYLGTYFNQFWLSHRYWNDGVYTVTVTIVAQDGITTGTATAQVVVHNAAPQISLPSWWDSRVGTPEDQEASISGIVTDSAGETVTLTINFGDGSAPEQQVLGFYDDNPRDFFLSHVYANSGAYTVTLTATDDDGATSIFALPVNIWNVMPAVYIDGYYGSGTEGAAVTTSGWFYDQGAEEGWTAMVDYGDGSGLQPVALNGNSFELSHVYADEGVYLMNVYVTDSDGGMGMATLWVEIYNVDPMVNEIYGEIDEGSTFTFSGSFTDPGADTWTATVDYGDGSGEQPLALDGQTFQLSHTYANGWGDYSSGSVWVRDGDGYGGASWIYLIIRNVAPVVHAEGGTINAGSVFTSSVSITDPGAEEMWAAFINYGDGTWESLGVDRTFQLSHAYETSGTYSVTIEVYDDTDVGTITVPVVVRTPPPSVSLQGTTIHEGEALSLQGSFVSQGSAWTGTVDYGDGSGEQPLAVDGTTFTLGHVYADNGSYTVTVRIQDGEGGVGTATAQVVVENVAPMVTASHDAPQYWGLPVHFTGTVIDPGVADTSAGLAVSWALGDGTTASGLTTIHTYSNPGAYVAVLTADDKDGGSGAVSTALQIQKRPSSLTCDDALAVFGFPVTLNAQLADALPGAQLGGKRLAFRLDTATDLGSSTTSDTGLGSVQSPGNLAPGHYTLTVSFAEDLHYTGAQAHCELTVTGSDGHITGGGLSFANKAHGGFNVKVDNAGQPRGELQFKNGSIRFHAHTMTALGISAERRSGWFSGTGEDGRHFTAYVEDNGEPGTHDVFKLWIDGVLQTGDGRLSGGNIQIHSETLAMTP